MNSKIVNGQYDNETTSLFYDGVETWRNFWIDVSEMLHYTKYLTVIKHEEDDTSGGRVDDFEDKLITYLNEKTRLSLLVLTSTVLKKSLSSELDDNRIQRLKNLTNNRQIMFILFDTLENLSASWKQTISLFSSKARTSFFILVVTEENLNDLECKNPGELHDDIVFSVGELFERIWTEDSLLEVFLIFPNLCSSDIILKYDPIKAYANKLNADGITVLTRDTPSKAFMQRYTNFHGYPIKINIFQRMPTFIKSMPINSRDAYASDMKNLGYLGGLDGYALANLVNRLNFSAVLLESEDKGEYGYKWPNGTFSGSLGDIINRRMDISLNARFIKIYGSDQIEFTGPVYYDEFCVLAPKSLPIPTWMSIFLVFSIPVWIAIGVSMFVSGFVWCIMKTKFPSRKTMAANVPHCFLFLEIALSMVSAPLALLPKINRERLLIATCLIFNLIFAGLFQGYLSTAYSTISFFPDISTLKQLDESGLPVATKNSDIFGINLTKVGDSLTKKIFTDQRDSVVVAAVERSVTVVERRTDAGLLINLNFTDEIGNPKLHIVNECPRSYHLAYISYKGYPFLRVINRFFQKTVEAGLNKKWYADTEFSILLEHRQHATSAEKTKKLNLLDVQTSFFLLTYGLTFSTAVFLCEMLIYHTRKIKRKRKAAKRNDLTVDPIIYGLRIPQFYTFQK